MTGQLVHRRHQSEHETSTSTDPDGYKQSTGGGYYVSITSGFYCIDIRRFFVLPFAETETDVKPTRQGIASHLREWYAIRRVINATNSCTHRHLATARQSYYGDDHQNHNYRSTAMSLLQSVQRGHLSEVIMRCFVNNDDRDSVSVYGRVCIVCA